MEHAEKYQDEDRKKIIEMWVPAAILLETNLKEDAQILRAEARHRLKKKEGIKVFSRPDQMKAWCDAQNDISYDEVKHLFVDAGTLVPGFSKDGEGIEFFVHSPFVSKTKEINRNDEAIVVQATFNNNRETKIILGSDISHKVWNDIVEVTKYKENEERLEWDLFNISHHCSYLALSEEKGDSETIPDDKIKWMFEDQGHVASTIISTSNPIPTENTDQPPHRQAARYYEKVTDKLGGEFKVTMDHPSTKNPKPMVFTIKDDEGAKLVKTLAPPSIMIGSRKPPRAGYGEG